MKVILINPAFNRYGGVKGHGGSMVPLNLCYLAACARRSNPDVEFRILDSEIEGMNHEDTVRETVSFSPDLIGITTNTCVFDSVIALTLMLKTALPDVPVVLGGPHVSALPERSLEESGAEFVAIGEGELTFEDLVSRIRTGNSDWDAVDGLVYKDDKGQIRTNRPRQLIGDLDDLPFPARDLVRNELYTPPPTKRVSLGTSTLIATSRGCPHNCGFCGARTVWTKKTRTRRPEAVVAEIRHCVERYAISTFHFTDEYFTAGRKRVVEICRLIMQEGLKINWVCSARAQGLDLYTLRAMKAAGCHEISFGIESGNRDILRRIDKSLDPDEARRAIRLTKKAGIITHASYMLGYIGETEETIRDTIRLAKELNTHVAAFFVASPLPGTRFYREALEEGLIRADATWADYSPLSNRDGAIDLPGLPAPSIRKWHRRALRGYYFRPGYIVMRLISIRHWYEVSNLLAGLRLFFRIKS
jgi:radical SAM superfamily enzyme YgiQ (UPF0313 family)